ncbi:BTAD domain-containing putative transcriptional regulator [Nonomuraea muscovyensis]|uniref:Putative ATPase/DNA-binding SARP family transcriptional activator n=1 Tax=Nonomuraea muscovyensis TaxID=1124761 RepID=A0A7X0CDF6_9ACTN|nr:BTAD domain-containing putative transcriptional regulator [Nonomuraea muscovyensis]MBB6351806.1 putative ATPase/DNA-binding SARP family transcriptional activator [Nonomuraea muscovyensis]
MRFEILGPTRVVGEDGKPVPLGGPRMRGLLTLLALDVGRVVRSDVLVDGLYGEQPPEGVANALQAQVSRLRRALGRDRVEFHPAGYRLAADAADVDAHRFERLAAEGGHALRAGDARLAATLLREALAMWRGTALADAPFAAAAAAGLEERRLAATEDRVQADLELGRHRELVAELRQLTAAHPLRERLRVQLMRALYGSGRQAEALSAYEEARRALDEELGLAPGPELAAAHLAVLRGDPALGTAAPDVPAREPEGGRPRRRTGVRAQLTSFVGRDEELEQVAAHLRRARLVTLIGAGGSGKTRLALEAAGRYAGDVCFVQLGPVAGSGGDAGGGGDVPGAVLAGLGIRESLLAGPERLALDPAARLVTALAERDLLLVLDNCEHVVASAAELADLLLAACPRLRVLVTSREALGITGERLLPVAPLRMPPADAPNPLDYPAVRLFADRAAAVRPGFAVDEDTAAQVVAVCRALDGLPLAIELAAARLRTLTVAEVAARLDDRFRLLAKGSRTALPRHQTLRAVVAWSWDLLDEDEQRLARRLTVFADGATPGAAERVCGLPEEVLFALADKSLVEVAGGRYRMLETIRAFCAERLAEAGESEALREAHAAYYLDLAMTADPHLRRAEQLEWLALLDEEDDDLDAALRWAAETGRTELGMRLLAHAACYWWMRGHRVTRAALARRLLAGSPVNTPAGLEEEYAICVLVAAWGGEPSPELRNRLADLQRRHPVGHMLARLEFLSMLLPMFTGPPGDIEAVRALQAQVAGTLPAWPDALSQAGVAFVLQGMGRFEEARAGFEQALVSFGKLGERWGTTLALTGLGTLAFDQGRFAEAYELAGRSFAVAEELGSVPDMAESLCSRGDARARLDDLAGAEADYLLAADLSRRVGHGETMALAHAGLGEVAMRRGDAGTARRRLEQALAECPDGWYSAVDIRHRIVADLRALAGGPKDGRGDGPSDGPSDGPDDGPSDGPDDGPAGAADAAAGGTVSGR